MIKIIGHSGFGVELIDENTIRKVSRGSGAPRLQRQISKQKNFHLTAQSDCIRAPRVLAETNSKDFYSADMEFIAAKDFVQFFMDSNRDEINRFMDIISDNITTNINSSVLTDVSMKIIEKTTELEVSGVPQCYTQAAAAFCCKPVLIPVGPCHGDLTFSNMLFKGTAIYFIDFLDSFVESPIQDLVKLRQDTWFGWSLGMYRAEYDRTKVEIIFRYLDKIIQKTFSTYEWYQRHYFLFQLINLMRIIPYCKYNSTKHTVIKHLESMLSEKHYSLTREI